MPATKAIPVGGSGDKIKCYIALLPCGDRTEPKNVTIVANGTAKANGQTVTVGTSADGPGTISIQVDGAVALNATSIALDPALPRDVPANTPLVFNAGTAQETSTTTTAAANAGDTSLSVIATVAAIADNSVAAVNLPGQTSITLSSGLPDNFNDGTEIIFNQGDATEQTATLTAIASAGATEITVEPLTKDLVAGNTGEILPDTEIQIQPLQGQIAGGSPILFNEGDATESLIILTEDILENGTVLKFHSLQVDITPGNVADYTARLRLLGGTSTGRNISPNREGVQHFEDPQGFEDGAITNATWEIPWSGTLVEDDLAYMTAEEAVFQSPRNNREAFVWIEKPGAKGTTQGNITKGPCVITSFQDTLGSSAILTTGWTFTGQGTPERERNGKTLPLAS